MINIFNSLRSPRIRISVLLTISVLAILFCFLNLPIVCVGTIELVALACCIVFSRKFDVTKFDLFQYKPHWFWRICEWYWTFYYCFNYLLRSLLTFYPSLKKYYFMQHTVLNDNDITVMLLSNILVITVIILTAPICFYSFRLIFKWIAEFIQKLTKFEKYYLVTSSCLLIIILIAVSSITSFFVFPVDRELYVSENMNNIVIGYPICSDGQYYCDFFFNTDTASLLRSRFYDSEEISNSRHPLSNFVISFFTPLFYAIGTLFALFFRSYVYSISLGIAVVQIILFALTGVLLARLFIPLTNVGFSRIISILYVLSFPVLFCFCPERLILSSFFLVLAVYIGIKENRYLNSFVSDVFAFGITSLALAPIVLINFIHKRYLQIAFLFLLLIFVSLSHKHDWINYNTQSIKYNKSAVSRLDSYFQFVSSCFHLPRYKIVESELNKDKVQCNKPIQAPSSTLVIAVPSKTDVFLGIIIITLCCVSAIKYLSHEIIIVCSFWLLLSFGIIGVIGFGNSECVLYCSYFSWAVIPLALLPFYWLWQKFPRLPIPQALYIFAAYLAISNLYFIYQVVQVVSERYIVPPGM